MNSMTPIQTADAHPVALAPIAIPLARLVLSEANVRKTGAKDGIAELAASIAAHGLRQNLNVRAVDGSDRFEVVAGGRRLRALRLLARQKQLPRDATVPCIVLAADEDAAEISLAENAVRAAMHPDDQFAAFQALVDGGLPVEDVAARFGVTPALVERRLKLARVSPRLRALFRKGGLTLEQMMAFTVADSHDEQERVWAELPEWSRAPERIREALTQQAVRFDTPLARFVGVEAYTAAGGAVIRDLFDTACEGYASDRLLLLTLADARLQALAESVRAEGWNWVRCEVERDYGIPYRRVYPSRSEDGAAAAFAPADLARAGAMVRVGRDGGAEIDRGLVHPNDLPQEEAAPGKPHAARAEAGSLPDAVVEDLTAHRTAALRLELACNPAVALAAVVHALAAPLFYGSTAGGTSLDLRARSAALAPLVAVAADHPAHQALEDAAAQLRALLPEDAGAFFGWCLVQPQVTLLTLLAFAAGMSVNAVRGRHETGTPARLAHADALAGALALDMAAHWRPSVAGFYGRLTKAALVRIVGEARAPLQVNIGAVKKPEAARYVAEAMAGTGWLPAPLRPAEVPASA